MSLRKKCIAIEAAAMLLVAALVMVAAAAAPPAGRVTQATGPLFAQAGDGRLRVLAPDSVVEAGYTLVSGSDTYAQVRFADHGVVTLRPSTQVSIDAFSFDEGRPADGRTELTLVEGAMRVESGGAGRHRYIVKSPAGSLDTLGATVIVEHVPPAGPVAARAPIQVAAADTVLLAGIVLSDAPAGYLPRAAEAPMRLAQSTASPVPGAKPPGLYIQVLDGVINLTNGGGSQNFSAGQFGLVPSFKQPPVVLPANPGIQFTPPPSFTALSGPKGGGSPVKPGSVDCEVR